jgi:hypothetical protein
MALHMSLRLAWHDNGWNGHICKKPDENGYCIGRHSYPGDLIGKTRNLDYDMEHAGEDCSKLKCSPACSLSINAFGSEYVTAHSDPPDWMMNNYGKNAVSGVDIPLPPATACTWCYEAMYGDNVEATGHTNRKYDNNLRFENAKEYFSQFEEGRSLVFYYAGYSNPFSEEETQNYVLVGVSRIKKIDDFYYYNDVVDEIKQNYANGVVWQKPITSCYPNEGLRIPYEKYMDNEEVLNRILFKPENRSPFKYGSREVSNDDAISIIWRFLEIVDVLIEVGDKTEDWEYRKAWLNSLLAELWESRGPYPGLPAVLSLLDLNQLVSVYIKRTNSMDMKQFYSELIELLNGNINQVGNVVIEDKTHKKVIREFKLRDEDEQNLLLNILPRFDITDVQMSNILSEDRTNVSITASLDDIVNNPYIIFEQYVGYDNDDSIPFYKIDNGILPSPELGLEAILEKDSAERLRALCVDELNRIASHSFGNASTILANINKRLLRMADWMNHVYKMQNFKVDWDVLSKALYIREDNSKIQYLYLKHVYENERMIEDTFKMLADRPDITLKVPIDEKRFVDKLIKKDSDLMRLAQEKYESILKNQARICMQVFIKPISIISGAAGTGKTTVIEAIIDNIVRVHGIGTGFLIMTPTGKATERVKRQTGKPSSTIHSFLAQNGWINDNFTLKRTGGSQYSDVNTIIIDECSMIDLNLFATLIRAINWNSVQRLILVGDPNQLPPIGRGKVFVETIQWLKENYPNNVGVLKDNIRQLLNTVQGNGTYILDLAQVFIQEEQTENQEIPVLKEKLFRTIQGAGDIDKDMSVYFWNDKNELDALLKSIMIQDMEKMTGNHFEEGNENKIWSAAISDNNKNAQPEKIQVISPYRGEFYGTDEINRYMQNTFNGNWSKRFNIDGIGLFDKVIQYRNRPQSDPAYAYNLKSRVTEKNDIYNGEIGTVRVHGIDIDKFKNRKLWRIERFQVTFSGITREGYWYNYGKNLLKDNTGRWIPEQKPIDNLELAYAISVHKSQGSEFDYVYIVIPKRDSHLLSMELIYTAITRAQKHVTIFIQEDIGTLTNLSRLEKSAVKRINSSVFGFNPLPEEFIYFNNWYAEGKKLTTLTDYLVRSKSEVIIANMLFDNGIYFKYEEPLYAPDGSMYLPDFTVTFRGETYYWEHVGMLNDAKYKDHWDTKLQWYNKHFKDRLLVTYESDTLSHEAKKIIDSYK